LLQTNGGWCSRCNPDPAATANGENLAIELMHGSESDRDALVSTRDGLMQEPKRVTDVAVVV